MPGLDNVPLQDTIHRQRTHKGTTCRGPGRLRYLVLPAEQPPARTPGVLRARCPHFMLPHRHPLRRNQRPLHNQSNPMCHRVALL
ncbi:hypothetical protein BJV78DRAFT_1226209, partial [Lactifluus subvellereus]